MMNSVLVIVLTVLAYVDGAPVNHICSSSVEMFAYCDQTPMAEIGINELYTESDRITDILEDLCLNYNDIVSTIFLITFTKMLFVNV